MPTKEQLEEWQKYEPIIPVTVINKMNLFTRFATLTGFTATLAENIETILQINDTSTLGISTMEIGDIFDRSEGADAWVDEIQTYTVMGQTIVDQIGRQSKKGLELIQC